MFQPEPSMLEENLQELIANAYDLLGDVIAVDCLTACYGQVAKDYDHAVVDCYILRLGDYLQEHTNELSSTAGLVRRQLKTSEGTVHG